MTIKLTRRTVAVVTAAAIGIGIAGVSYAAIPSTNGAISACKDAKGALKVIDADAGQTCASNQQLLTWNQQGPQGTPGISGYEIVWGTTQYVGSGNYILASAACPEGKMPIAGGGLPGNLLWSDRVTMTASFAQPIGRRWFVSVVETTPTSTNWSLTPQVICANVG